MICGTASTTTTGSTRFALLFCVTKWSSPVVDTLLHEDRARGATWRPKTATPALAVATRAAERPRPCPAHRSFDKVAAGAKYSVLRAQKTDWAGAANDALQRQMPSAAMELELFQLYEEEPGRALLLEVAVPQDRQQRRYVEQIIEEFVPVQILDVLVASVVLVGEQDQIMPASSWSNRSWTQEIAVPKISRSRPTSSSRCSLCYANGGTAR